MGVDPMPRAKYRRGELRMVLALPEPWTEAQRADFIRTIEILAGHADVGPFAGLDVTTGDVEIQGMTIVTWVPGVDEQPEQVLTPTGLDIMILRYGLRESQARKDAVEAAKQESYNLGYAVGIEQGCKEEYERLQHKLRAARDLLDDFQQYSHFDNSDGSIPDVMPMVQPGSPIVEPVFKLGPLEPDEITPVTDETINRAWSETCINCGEKMTQCNVDGCGGHKEPGFRWPLGEPAEQEG